MVWCSVIKVGYKHSWELVSRAGLQFPSSLAARHFFSPPQLHTGFSGTTCQSEGFLLASKGDGRQQTHLPDTKTSLQKCHVHFVCTAAISHRFHYSRIWRLFSWLIDTFLCSIRICHSRSERLKLSLVVASTLQNKTFPVTEGRKPAILSELFQLCVGQQSVEVRNMWRSGPLNESATMLFTSIRIRNWSDQYLCLI